jgi:hypothetical protein
MTARRRRPANSRSLSAREWERLLRQPSYLRPLPPPVPLHRMGQARIEDHHQDDNNTNSKRSTE